MTSVMSVAFGDLEESLPCLFFWGRGQRPYGNTQVQDRRGEEREQIRLWWKASGCSFCQEDCGHWAQGEWRLKWSYVSLGPMPYVIICKYVMYS